MHVAEAEPRSWLLSEAARNTGGWYGGTSVAAAFACVRLTRRRRRGTDVSRPDKYFGGDAFLAGPTAVPRKLQTRSVYPFARRSRSGWPHGEMRLDSAALGKGRIRMDGAPGPARCWSSTITGMLFLGLSLLRADLVRGPVGASRRLNGPGHRRRIYPDVTRPAVPDLAERRPGRRLN